MSKGLKLLIGLGLSLGLGGGLYLTLRPRASLPAVETSPTLAVEAATQTASPTVSPSPASSTPTRTSLPPAPTPAPTQVPARPSPLVTPEPFPLARPIGPDHNQRVDPTYRFGSTQDGQRETHHGVEFLTSFGNPVLAAAAGKVVVAGSDQETLWGPYPNFYGQVVILEHTLPGYTQPIFTLYAHLSQISVSMGEPIARGEEIGKVGFSGAATGSHLHFEVRVGINDYDHTRNPELWLVPFANSLGQRYGALAGFIQDTAGRPLQVDNVSVEFLPENDHPGGLQFFIETYADPALVGRPPWEENFALGDLPPGKYRLSFIAFGLREQVIEILPGQVTRVTITVPKP